MLLRASSLIAAAAGALIAVSAAAATPMPGEKPGKPEAKKEGQDHGQFCGPGKKTNECGWFWGADFTEPVKEEKEETAEAPPPPKQEPPKPEEAKITLPPPFLRADAKERCKAPETWDSQCGWVDPGTNYAWMKVQEEKLAQQMVMTSNSPWAVKQYQHFVLWAIDRVSEVASVWSFNVSQDQDLNPNVRNVTNRQGLRWAATKKPMERKAFFDLVEQDGGFLVYWTRSDCLYCKKMLPAIRVVAKETGLDVWNASLDGKCEPEFKDRCMVAPQTTEPAAFLQVKVVPDLMLYMPKEKSWLRIASGVDSAEPILSRMKLYAQGVRAAAISGSKSDVAGQASVDFTRQVNQAFQDTGFVRTDQKAPVPQ